VTTLDAASPAIGPTAGPVRVRWLGTVDYRKAWDEQRRIHAQVRAGEEPDTVLLLEHPSVYTAGRRTQPWERPLDGTPVIDVDRGGQITWHGPGQLVGYPILTLPEVRLGRPFDVVAYVRRVEQMLIDACAELGVTTIRVPGRSGVWLPADPDSDDSGSGGSGGVGAGVSGSDTGTFDGAAGSGRPERKVAAIGIRVVRGVTMHGFALNCNPDVTAFDKIVACGIRDAGVTSLSLELGRDVTVDEMRPIVERHLPTICGT
jgi:lipoyl(octanoyl) transferase